MKKIVIIIPLISLITSCFSQSDTVVGFYNNGQLGKKVVFQGLGTTSTYFLLPNANTWNFDSTKVVTEVIPNAAGDSFYVYKGGVFIRAIKLGTSGGGGGTPSAPNYSVQTNLNNAFTGYSTFTFKTADTASSGRARGFYIGTTTLSAIANGDTLVGVDIARPTFVTTNGATTYTNTNQYALRVQGVVGLTGTYTPAGLYNSNATASGFYVSRTLTGNSIFGSAFMDNLVASANNSVLVGVRIFPTFTNGAFTGVTNTALQVNGNAIFSNDVSTNTVTSAAMISVGSTAIMIGQFAAPSITFANGYGLIGTEQTTNGVFTGTAVNDFYLRSFQARPIWLGNTTNGAQLKIDKGVTYFTQTEPTTPASGAAVTWYNGTTMSWKGSDGVVHNY